MEFLNPIGDKVLLAFPSEGRLENGVWVIGETATRMDAKVVAAGNRVSGVRVGDTVIANRLSGVQVTEYGVRYRLVPENEILGVVEQ